MYIYLYVLVRSYTNNKRTRGPERSVKPQLHATRVVLTAIMDANTDHSSVCQQRLKRRREQERARRASETSQQRESCLRKRREAYKRRKDTETPEKRSARLATESIAKRQQRASETECFDCNNLQALGRIGLPVNQMIRGLLDYSIKDNHRVTRLAVKQNRKGLLDYNVMLCNIE